jgi:hypothetical protein
VKAFQISLLHLDCVVVVIVFGRLASPAIEYLSPAGGNKKPPATTSQGATAMQQERRN